MRPVFIFALYRILLVAATPFLLAYVVYRGLRERRYLASLGERLGFLNASSIPTIPGGIWLHAVSVGEVLSAVELIKRIRAQLNVPVYVSVSTIAGHSIADEKLAGITEAVFYAPLDYVFVIRRILRLVRPAVVVVMETEIWPNLYREPKRSGCALVIVNGRISDRAMPRYSQFRWFFCSVLSVPDWVLAQSQKDAARYVDLGAPPEKVLVAGNLKYDFDPRACSIAPEIRSFIDARRDCKVWIAASTMPPSDPSDVDEDDVVIRAFQEVGDDVLLILVPRKPERFDVAAGKLREAGVRFVRRSELHKLDPEALVRVLLLDSMGELSGLFAIADVAFMGGTLARRGGHNILEPAFFGCPVIVGPHMENFGEIARQFSSADACIRIESGTDLAGAVSRLLHDPEYRRAIGLRAKAEAEAQRGATERAIDVIRTALENAVPTRPHMVVTRALLRPLSETWAAGVYFDRRRKIRRQRRLSTPVISVGGLAMGGTGKTPLVAHIAKSLHARGINVAILTRGYGREDASANVLIKRGDSADVRTTGDEAQIFIRCCTSHVGVGTDRYAVGLAMEDRFRPDVFLLDDGFQHASLYRDFDIVAIDSLDPLAGGVFPAGTLRESFDALVRASAVVLTRTQPGRSYPGLQRMVRAENPGVPIFTSSIVPTEWRHVCTEEVLCPRAFAGKRVVAFCGLGNPGSFRRSLFDLSIGRVAWLRFPDHNRYSKADIDRIRGVADRFQAEAVLTTEKDAMHFTGSAGLLHAAYYLRIETTVEPGPSFLDSILRLITRNTGRPG